MIEIDRHTGNDFIQVNKLAGQIKGIVQHPEHVYKIMADHFGDTFFIAREKNTKDKDQILGFMLGFVSRKIAGSLFVWQIAISEQAQGKRIGSKLLEHTIDYATQSTDCKSVLATVEVENIASQKLFEKMNFKIISKNFTSEEKPLIFSNGKEAVKNYYGSGTDQIFYQLMV